MKTLCRGLAAPCLFLGKGAPHCTRCTMHNIESSFTATQLIHSGRTTSQELPSSRVSTPKISTSKIHSSAASILLWRWLIEVAVWLDFAKLPTKGTAKEDGFEHGFQESKPWLDWTPNGCHSDRGHRVARSPRTEARHCAATERADAGGEPASRRCVSRDRLFLGARFVLFCFVLPIDTNGNNS